SGDGFLRLDDQVTQNGVVVAESMLEFVHGCLTALDVKANVVRLDKLLDGVGKLAASPVFQAMHLAAVAGDDRLIALDHGGHLLALIGMHDEHYFVVTHKLHSLWMASGA